MNDKPKQSILQLYNSLNDGKSFVATFFGHIRRRTGNMQRRISSISFRLHAPDRSRGLRPCAEMLISKFVKLDHFLKVRVANVSFRVKIVFGQQKISTPSLIKILSVLPFYEDLSRSSMLVSLTVSSGKCLVASRTISSRSSSKNITGPVTARSSTSLAMLYNARHSHHDIRSQLAVIPDPATHVTP